MKNRRNRNRKQNQNQAQTITVCALFTAFTAICSQIQIPIPPIPINLGLLAVFLAGALLGAKYGACSILVYVLLGAVGVPVFVGMKGGLATLTGATGGYIIGYVACAWITGFIIKRVKNKFYLVAGAMALGLAVCYAFGTIWYMYISGNPLQVALGYCVLPFLPGDAGKIVVATLLTKRLRKIIEEFL